MLRRMLPIVVLLLSSVTMAGAAAAPDCRYCLDSVALQTRDGQPWTAGKPVTLVLHVGDTAEPQRQMASASALARSDSTAGAQMPATAQAVVMQTDGDRTKCLGVPLKLVQADDDGNGGLYAGLFFPFRAARYDGKLVVGSDVQDITFDVNQMVAGAAPAGDLPAAEPIDTSAPLPTLTIATLLSGALGVIALTVAVGRRRARDLSAV